MGLRKTRKLVRAVFLGTLLLSAGGPATPGRLDDPLGLVPASHADSRSLDVTVSCPPTLGPGAVFDAIVTFRNRTPTQKIVSRGALTVHAGALRVSGPRAVAASAVVDPVGADGGAGGASIPIRLVVSPPARRGSFVTFALSFFGHVGTNPRRQLLGTGRCAIEISTTPEAPVLTGLEVIPPAATIAKGQSQPFVARGVFSDGSLQEPFATTVASLGAPMMIGGEEVKFIRVGATYRGRSTVAHVTASGRQFPVR